MFTVLAAKALLTCSGCTIPFNKIQGCDKDHPEGTVQCGPHKLHHHRGMKEKD
jgi:hypothetical protein